MDPMFNSRLQTMLEKLGRQGEYAPPRSQDPADKHLHEYFVAETGRSLFDKRRKKALEQLKLLDVGGDIASALKVAAKGAPGVYDLFDTENYRCTLQTKMPVTKVDMTMFANELVKAGVDPAIISAAQERATTQNTPAEVYTVVVKRA